jgi:hypothetical protein
MLHLGKMPVVVVSLSDAEAFLARVAENLLRNNELNPIEEAKGYSMLVQNGWTINAIGEKIGKSDSYVCRRLSMLTRLETDLLGQFSNNGYRNVSSSHMELISLIPEKSKQREFVNLVERKRLSVRSLENLLNGIPPPTKILIEDSSGECTVKIPNDFLRAVKMATGNYVRLCVRGRKLVLENLHSKRRRAVNVHVSSKGTSSRLLPSVPTSMP